MRGDGKQKRVRTAEVCDVGDHFVRRRSGSTDGPSLREMNGFTHQVSDYERQAEQASLECSKADSDSENCRDHTTSKCETANDVSMVEAPGWNMHWFMLDCGHQLEVCWVDVRWMHHITGIRQVRQGTREAEVCLWRADLDLKTVWSRWEPLSLT